MRSSSTGARRINASSATMYGWGTPPSSCRGVTIGTGAVVGSQAVVTKDVAPYEVVVGVPAKPIRTRFAPDVIEKLLAIAWWDWDRPTLEERFKDFLDLPRIS